MKRMLINATHSEEIRVALADGQKLYNLDIDIPGQERKKGNIYKGKITRVEPSLEAAFVDYGANRHGFLPYKEISRNYYTDAANRMKERPPISVAIKQGTEVIIQVNKEERGNKGAAISTYISLAGRYLVYMPENPKAGGISRRIEGNARQELKASLSKVTQPKNSGVIVRTAGIGRTSEELDWDLNYLDQVWTAIKTNAANRKAPFFIYQESDIFIRAIRDYLRPDVGEILIDNKKIYEKVRDFMQQVMPHNLKKLSYYNDTTPLFSRYQIEGQIQSAFSREVRLPSGGSIVIDHTEAMISIDINSARATKGADIEETATNTNLEAADEIARQLRIRDLGGLVVIDFIDMRNHKNQRSVELQLNEAVSNDRARIQTSKISRFGLLEMSRQRLRSSINEASQFVCPRCSGHGFIRNIESLSVSILRIMEEEALKPETGKVIAQVPTKVANFIMNEKRSELNNLESRHSVPMLMIANEFYQTPQFEVTRLKKSEAGNVDINTITLNKPESEEEAENKSSQNAHQHRQVAAVDVLAPTAQAPERVETQSGLTGWIKSLFTSNNSTTQSKPQNKTKHQNTPKKPVHKHKQQQSTGKKPQHQTKPKQNKQPNKQQKQAQNKQQGKKPQHNKQTTNKGPQNKKPQQNKQPLKQGKKPQANKQPSPQHNKVANKPVDTEKVQTINVTTEDTVVESPKTNEQMLKRPLGSVASYAAAKAKQDQNTPQNSLQQTPKSKDKVETEKKDKANEPVEVKASPVDKTPNAKLDKTTNISKDTSNQDVKPVEKQSDLPLKEKTQVKDSSLADVKDNKVKKPEATNDSKQKKKPQTSKTSAPKDKEVTATPKAKPPKKKSATKKQTTTDDKVEKNADTVTKDKTETSAPIKNKATATKGTKTESKPATKEKPKTQSKAQSKAMVKPVAKESSGTQVTEPKKSIKPKNKSVEKTPSSIKEDSEKLVKATKPKGSSESKQKTEKKVQTEVKVAKKTKSTPEKPKKVTTKPKKKMPDPTSGIDFDI